jgi:hypothetical protein
VGIFSKAILTFMGED